MAQTKPTAFRLTDEDLSLLDVISQHTGIRSRTEGLRAVLRYYVRAEGIEISKPKKSAKPKRAREGGVRTSGVG